MQTQTHRTTEMALAVVIREEEARASWKRLSDRTRRATFAPAERRAGFAFAMRWKVGSKRNEIVRYSVRTVSYAPNQYAAPIGPEHRTETRDEMGTPVNDHPWLTHQMIGRAINSREPDLSALLRYARECYSVGADGLAEHCAKMARIHAGEPDMGADLAMARLIKSGADVRLSPGWDGQMHGPSVDATFARSIDVELSDGRRGVAYGITYDRPHAFVRINPDGSGGTFDYPISSVRFVSDPAPEVGSVGRVVAISIPADRYSELISELDAIAHDEMGSAIRMIRQLGMVDLPHARHLRDYLISEMESCGMLSLGQLKTSGDVDLARRVSRQARALASALTREITAS